MDRNETKRSETAVATLLTAYPAPSGLIERVTHLHGHSQHARTVVVGKRGGDRLPRTLRIPGV